MELVATLPLSLNTDKAQKGTRYTEPLIYCVFTPLDNPYHQLFVFPQVPTFLSENNMDLILGWQLHYGFQRVDLDYATTSLPRPITRHINPSFLGYLRDSYSSDFSHLEYTNDPLNQRYKTQRILTHFQCDYPLPRGVDLTELIYQDIVDSSQRCYTK